MNDLVLALIHDKFCLYIFFGDVTRRLIIRLGFLLDLFIYFSCIFFICKFGFIIKKNVKGALHCQNGLIFGRVVPQTVLYLPVKFRGNPSFVWRSTAVLMLGFNRGHVRVLCFFGPKTLKANSNLAHIPWTYKT